MRHSLKYVLVLALMIFLSCDKEEDYSIDIDGKWNLVYVGGGFAGLDITIKNGDIVWDFDDEMVEVKNNYSGDFNVSLPTGTYSYSIDEQPTETFINVNGGNYYFMQLSKDSITLSQEFVDGFGYLFVKK